MNSTKPHFSRNAASSGGVILAIVLWSIFSRQLANQMLLPGPLAVLRRLWRDLNSPHLWVATGHTLLEAVAGGGLGIFIALPLAYAIYKSRVLDAMSGPLVAFSQAIPSVALAPLLVVWLGYGLFPIAVLCALIVFFPILNTAVLGLKSLPREVLEAARLDGARGLQLLRYIEAPLAVPALLAGFRTGFTLSVIGAVVGEYVMGGKGLGNRLSLQAVAADMTGLFATVTVLCLWAALITQVIAIIESRAHIMRALRVES